MAGLVPAIHAFLAGPARKTWMPATSAGTTAERRFDLIGTRSSPSTDVEWVLRLYNQTNPNRHSRLSFYTFNLGSPAGQGNGSYMEYGVSANDETPIELGKWVFVVGQAEHWISATDRTTGCILWKQAIEAKRVVADKYADFNVHPQDGSGPVTVGGTQTTGYKGAISHLAIWNRLLSVSEIASIWTAGTIDLRGPVIYPSS